MTWFFIDCRDCLTKNNFAISIVADNEEGHIAPSVQHAVAVHSQTDSKELREMIGGAVRPQA